MDQSSCDNFVQAIVDKEKSIATRTKIFMDLLGSLEEEEQGSFIASLLDHIDHGALDQLIQEIMNGPVRPATVLAVIGTNKFLNFTTARCQVITMDGQERYPLLLPDSVDSSKLQAGMTIVMDAAGTVVLSSDYSLPQAGPVASYQRELDAALIEVDYQQTKYLVHKAAALQQQELTKGDFVLFCPLRKIAFTKIPQSTDKRYRFLDKSSIPDIVVERDIGAPHSILQQLRHRTSTLLFQPQVLEQFGLRPRLTVLLTGPSGTGKTLTIKAYLREFYNLVQQRTGLNNLNSRVIRVKASELLSEWLGRSDKNIDELFDDIYQLASQPVRTNNSEDVLLPVVVVMEEIEGLTAQRGTSHGSEVYDRILGTFLQRLDDPTHDLSKLPIIWLTTTNRPDLIDAAMYRRLATVQARFTRLNQDAFSAVLAKKLKPELPYKSNGFSAGRARQDILSEVSTSLYSHQPANLCLTITFADRSQVLKYRYHFLTGSVVDTAVQDAVNRCVFSNDGTSAALTSNNLLTAFRDHIATMTANISPHNVMDYVDMPENSRVSCLQKHC